MLQRTASTVRALHALLAAGDGSTGLWNSGSRFCVTIEPKGISNLR